MVSVYDVWVDGSFVKADLVIIDSKKVTQTEHPRFMKESLFELGEYQVRALFTSGHSEGLVHPQGLLHPASL